MNKKEYAFFYTKQLNKTKKYTMLRVKVFNNNIDEAHRKCRTIADKLGLKLPGGWTSGVEKHYKSYYFGKIIDVPANTKIQPYTEHDKFIFDLIERESNRKYYLF